MQAAGVRLEASSALRCLPALAVVHDQWQPHARTMSLFHEHLRQNPKHVSNTEKYRKMICTDSCR
jgi:hypothetical protein